AKAEQLDGCYLLKTDRKNLSAEELWRIYNLLTRAEDAFRDMKSPLAVRPIFHHLEKRTDAHIFLCVLAYHLLNAIEKTLLDHGVADLDHHQAYRAGRLVHAVVARHIGGLARAGQRSERPVERTDDIADHDVFRRPRQHVAAALALLAAQDAGIPKLPEDRVQ